MINLSVYREVKSWKKHIHASRTVIAKNYLKLIGNVEVIGITGSVGKTLTQNAIASVLAQKYKTSVGEENLDPTFRIPQTILKTKPWYQKLVLEYGVEHPGDMDHYLKIIKPKIAVVTRVTPTHTKYFKDIQGVFSEKVKLVRAVDKNGHVVLNADDRLVVKMADYTKAKIWWYGQKAKNGVKISHFVQTLKGSKFRLHYQGQKASVTWKVVGRHQLLSAYSAATVGIVCSLTLKQIARGLAQVKTPKHRLNAITTKNISILDDTYNASPSASQESLATLIDLGKRKKKVAIFGEMKDLGEKSSEFHKKLGEKIAKTNINYLITIGKIAKIIGINSKKFGFPGKVIRVSNSKEAIFETKKIVTSFPKALVLVKGSRHAHLERIIYGLLHKSTQINCYHCGQIK